MSLLRHTSFVPEARAASIQSAENARDANAAIGRRVQGYLFELGPYAATGNPDTRMVLINNSPLRPKAVLLVRCYSVADRSGNIVGLVPSVNFYHDAKGIGVYEPDGLTADTKYIMTFLVME